MQANWKPIALSARYQLLHHHIRAQLKHYSFDLHRWLAVSFHCFRVSISVLSLHFFMHLCGHLLVRAQKHFSGPTLDLRNDHANA